MNRKIWVFTLSLALLAPTSLPSQPVRAFAPTAEDFLFLDLVQRKAFDYFLNEHHPDTGLVKDMASNFEPDYRDIASIAATGFGLAAIVVGAEKGWIGREEAREYCAKTLDFLLNGMESHRGFFFHFVHWQTGKRTNGSELSSIDTVLLIAGALTAGRYFKGTEVEALAERLYERVDFQWMLNGGETLSMGWHPQTGFLKSRWSDYNECLILYLLAIGSPTHPIPPASWRKVKKPIGVYGPYTLIYCPPLFTHQYSHIFLDLRGKNDGFADYFENSRVATLANRQFVLDHRGSYKGYSEEIWGLTASLGPNGYKAYGSEPGEGTHDGTIAPTAAGSSIVFTPELSLKALKSMHRNYNGQLWGKYGFSDAFNAQRGWYARDVLGIDQGPLLLMIENFRSELVWKFFMDHPAIRRGMRLAGFRPGTLLLTLPERPVLRTWRPQNKIQIDGNLNDWNGIPSFALDPEHHLELGEISGAPDASARIHLAWDKDFIYVAGRVRDEDVVIQKKGDQIWRDDILELYFDPEDEGLAWGHAKDFQVGFSPGPPSEKGRSPDATGGIGVRTNKDSFNRPFHRKGRSWAWFQDLDPAAEGQVEFRIERERTGYRVEARIAWKFLGLAPAPGVSLGFSAALHDIDRDGSEGKLNWHFLADGRLRRRRLGQLKLV